MEEEDNIIVRWEQEDVETSYNLLNKIKDINSRTVFTSYFTYFLVNICLKKTDKSSVPNNSKSLGT
jgi:hypothetical protein